MARAQIPDIHPCGRKPDRSCEISQCRSALRLRTANVMTRRNYCLTILRRKRLPYRRHQGYGRYSPSRVGWRRSKKDGERCGLSGPTSIPTHPTDAGHARARNALRPKAVVWSVSTGHWKREVHTRAAMNWDLVRGSSVNVVRRNRVLAKTLDWQKVYASGYKSCSYDAARQAARREPGISSIVAPQGQCGDIDTLLWWIAGGIERSS